MTIGSTTNESTGTGDGIITLFPFDFAVQDAGQVLAYLREEDGEPVQLTPGSDYNVTEIYTSTDGGEVTFTTAPEDGVEVILRRTTNFLQGTSIPLNRNLDERSLEKALDKLTMQDQDLLQRSDRSIQFPFGTDPNAINVLPSSDVRANKALIFDIDGNVTVSEDDYNDQFENVTEQAQIATAAAASATASASSATISQALAAQSAAAAQAAAGSALVDVISLGCVGDGVTNDLPALQAALAAGWRNFYIPDNCTVTCWDSLLLSYIDGGGNIVRYTGVTFRGANKNTSKIIFTNHAATYLDNASMPVGIGAYYTVAGEENNGTGLLSFFSVTILGPRRGCSVFIASSSHISFWDTKISTNSTNESGSDRAKFQVWMKDCIRVHAYDLRIGPAYIAHWCNGGRGVTNRATVAPNAVYNDDFLWLGCQFYGTSYAAIIDAGSGSEATRTIQACDFSNAERYYGYIGNKGVTLDYSQSWDEFGYKKIWLTDTDGSSGIMPYQYRGTKIANVIDPDTMNFTDFFLGGWASGATIQNNHFYNGITNMDLTGCYGSALVSGNNYRMNTNPTGSGAVPDNQTVHLYTGQTANGKIKYLGDYRVFGSVDREIVDFNSVVETELNGQTSQTVSATTYWTGYNYKSNPMGGLQVNAGTGGTRPSSFTVKAKIHLNAINPMIRLAGILCSGTVKARLHMGAGASGTPSGYQEVLFNLNQNSAGTWAVQYVRTQDQHLQNSFYSLSQNPLMFFGMINNTSNIDDQTALFIGVKGNATSGSAILELEFNCGFVTNRSGTYFRLHPKISYSNETDAAAEILAAETAVAGSTTSLTDCKTYLNTFTWDPGNLADGAAEVKSDITLTGARVGDYVVVIPPYSLQGLVHTAHVSANDTVTCVLFNKTGGAINLASSTGWKVINKGQ